MSILTLLSSDNYIVVNKTLSKNIGLVESFLYGELISEYRYYLREGKLAGLYSICRTHSS